MEIAIAGGAGGAAVGAVVGQVVGQMMSNDSTHRKWYDKWNNIYQFTGEYTDLIDMLLIQSPKAVVNDFIMKSSNHKVPGLGSHKFYYSGSGNFNIWDYITFEKKMDNHSQQYYYVCYSTKRQMPTFWEAVTFIFQTDANKVRCISIDTSRTSGPFPLFIDKLCSGREDPWQTKAIDHILKGWKTPNYNTKIIICGVRGSGKTYIGRLLKRRIETNDNTKLVRLYDDFNPSAPGVSIGLLVLSNAKAFTPVILLIDEIDVAYAKAVKDDKQDRHTVGVHTQDKHTLNLMLDMIGDTPNVIAIYTTEKSPDELYQNDKWHSFMRKGRVDYFLRYVPDGKNAITNERQFRCDKVLHSSINGYVDV